jgi:hypothetical protein
VGLGVAFGGGAVCVFDGAEASGDAGFASRNVLTVLLAVGVVREGGGVALDFADVGFAVVGVGGDRIEGDAGGVGIQDEGEGAGFGVPASQGDDGGGGSIGPSGFGGLDVVAVAVVEFGEHQVGAVELVAGGGEVRAEGVGVGAAGDAVVQEPGSLGAVGVGGGAGVGAQVVVQVAGDGAGLGEGGQGAGEWDWLGTGGDPYGQAAGGDVVDGGAAGGGGEQAVADEVLV